jgi:hypothetical protein
MRRDPFEGAPPRFIRAGYWRYEFAHERGVWWKRTRVDDYLPAVTLDQLRSVAR